MFAHNLDAEKAYNFYKRYLLDLTRDKTAIYTEYGFRVTGGLVPSQDWELFAAILLKDKAKPGDGADLEHHEVKSAVQGNSFEYQYHKHHGEDKLDEDIAIDHVFISYERGYAGLEVRFVKGDALAAIFESWRPGLIQNYQAGRQRYRKSIAFGFVREHGDLILKIEDGELIYPLG